MEREKDHMERNLQRRCTAKEGQAHGRIKCDPKTSVLSQEATVMIVLSF